MAACDVPAAALAKASRRSPPHRGLAPSSSTPTTTRDPTGTGAGKPDPSRRAARAAAVAAAVAAAASAKVAADDALASMSSSGRHRSIGTSVSDTLIMRSATDGVARDGKIDGSDVAGDDVGSTRQGVGKEDPGTALRQGGHIAAPSGSVWQEPAPGKHDGEVRGRDGGVDSFINGSHRRARECRREYGLGKGGGGGGDDDGKKLCEDLDGDKRRKQYAERSSDGIARRNDDSGSPADAREPSISEHKSSDRCIEAAATKDAQRDEEEYHVSPQASAPAQPHPSPIVTNPGPAFTSGSGAFEIASPVDGENDSPPCLGSLGSATVEHSPTFGCRNGATSPENGPGVTESGSLEELGGCEASTPAVEARAKLRRGVEEWPGSGGEDGSWGNGDLGMSRPRTSTRRWDSPRPPKDDEVIAKTMLSHSAATSMLRER